MARIELRASLLPLLQAIFTGLSTALGVGLMILWRPSRTRRLPFYSDASHKDPERILLACGENIACMFMPIVAIVEYLHQSRLLGCVPKQVWYRCFRASPRALVLANFCITLLTTVFFFVTANVPSKYPAVRIHQVAASALILFYALQATLKAILAAIFRNYKRPANIAKDVEDSEASIDDEKAFLNAEQNRGWWDRHHMKLRVLLAVALWAVLLGTWLCFMSRVVMRTWGGQFEWIRQRLSWLMAVLVHVATVSCVTLMGVMAVDMRQERFVLSTVAL